MQVHRALCTLSLTLGTAGGNSCVGGREKGEEEMGKSLIRERGGETNSNRELHQFPQTRNFLPGQHRDSGSP